MRQLKMTIGDMVIRAELLDTPTAGCSLRGGAVRGERFDLGR